MRITKKNFLTLIFFIFFVFYSFFTKDKQNYSSLSIKKLANKFFLLITPTTKPEPKEANDFYSVVRVIDGDTFEVIINDKKQKIRVIGINTPEINDPRKTVECFGKEASEKAKKLLLGKKVRLEKDPTQEEIDKYGRLLRYVFFEDGTDFGLTMIKEGYAFEYTYNIPYKYQQQYKQAQKQAEENKKGLWSDDGCGQK